MKKFYTFILVVSLISFSSKAQVSLSGVVNIYTAVNSIDYCQNTIGVASSAGFSEGDRVLIIQMKGADANLTNTASFGNINTYGNAGNYEFGTIASIAGTMIGLENRIERLYTPADKVQLIRVPVYNDADIDGVLTAENWNGTTGGVLVFEADLLTLNANIDVSGKGFRGGYAGNYPASCPTGSGSSLYYSDTLSGKGGAKGEGIVNLASAYLACRGKAVNGGGGGNDHNAGAGGGGNGNAGGVGGENDEPFFSCPGSPGHAGLLLDQTMAFDRIYLGGGGGAGHGNNTNGTSGGNGGGMIIIRANQIIGNTFSILSDGETVTDLAWGDGAGGGGAGGSILIEAASVENVSFIAKGGKGGDAGSDQCTGPGGGGAGGVLKHSGAALWPGVSVDITGGVFGTLTTATSPCFGENNGAANGSDGVIVPSLVYAESFTVYNPDFAFAGNDTLLCDGAGMTLNASGGVSYIWTPSTYLDDPFIYNPGCNPLSNITYVLQVTDINGCIDFDTITITVAEPVAANAGEDVAVCDGESVMLTASGGVEYAWSPGTYLDNIAIANPVCTPADDISYIVTVTDENGCVGIDMVSVVVNSSDFLTVSDDVFVCDGGSIELFASGGVGYLWSPPTYLDDASSSNPVCTPAGDITYYVTSASADGCTDVDTVSVFISPSDFLTTSDDVFICEGGSMELNASGGITYLWSPATYLDDATSPNPVCSPLSNIIYIVTSVNAEGCEDADTVSVELLSSDFAITDPGASVCVDGSVELNASGGITYLWSPDIYLDDATSPNPVCSPLTDMIYFVSVESAEGCVDVDTVTVLLFPEVNAVAGPDTTVCSGGQIQLFASGGVEYLWTPPTFLDLPTSSSPFCSLVESISYIVYVTDMNGCTATDTVDIIVLPVPDIIAGDDVTICRGDTVTLTASGGIFYTWTPDPLFGCGICESIEVSPLVTTTYIVVGENAEGCSSTDAVTVTVDICNAIENSNAQQIKIYPNPASDFIIVDLPPGLSGAQISITDLLGEHIQSDHKWINQQSCQIQLNVIAPQPIIIHIHTTAGIYSKMIVAGGSQ